MKVLFSVVSRDFLRCLGSRILGLVKEQLMVKPEICCFMNPVLRDSYPDTRGYSRYWRFSEFFGFDENIKYYYTMYTRVYPVSIIKGLPPSFMRGTSE